MAANTYDTTSADIARLMPSRVQETVESVIDFNTDTTPSKAQVEAIIQDAAEELALSVDDDIPTAAQPLAKRVLTFRAAMLVELGYFPNQIDTGESPYPQLKEEYETWLKRLIESVQDIAAGGDPGSSDDAPGGGGPLFTFPPAGTSGRALGSEDPVIIEW
jgi:hypothetical protein